jgi:hypothetical protein
MEEVLTVCMKMSYREPVHEIELHLSGSNLTRTYCRTWTCNKMPLTQKRLVETIIALLGNILEEATCHYNKAFNTVAVYYKFYKEGTAA